MLLRMLCLLCLCLLPVLGEAATFYVSTTGADSASCAQAQSTSSARRTINAGIACLSGGDTLLVGDGTYDEKIGNFDTDSNFTITTVPNGSGSAYTTIKAQNLHGVTLRPSSASGDHHRTIYFNGNAHHIRLEGLRVDNQNRATGLSSPLTSAGSQMQFVDLDVFDAGFSVVVNGGRDILFERLWVHNIAGGQDGGGAPCQPYNAASFCHGMYLQDGTDGPITITNSRIWDVNGWGIQSYVGNVTVSNSVIDRTYSGAIGVFGGGGSITVYNNVITNSWGRGIWASGTIIHNTLVNIGSGTSACCGGGIDTTSSTTVKNNLLVNMTHGTQPMIGQSGSASLVAGNVCTTAETGCTTVPAGSTFFVNPGAGNYRTHASSPARGKGVSIGSPYNVDPDGVTRPQLSVVEGGSGVDAGAFEFTTGAPVGPTPPPPPINLAITP